VRFVVDEVAMGKFLSLYFDFSLSVSFHHCWSLISNYMFLVPEGQTGEVGEPTEKQCPFGGRGAFGEKYFHLALKDSSSIDSCPMINQQKPVYIL
jgi:hypothetical protein